MPMSEIRSSNYGLAAGTFATDRKFLRRKDLDDGGMSALEKCYQW